MRIVGGRLKGRALHGPKSDAIRPTSDRMRESLFNILVHSYDDPLPGARVIDLASRRFRNVERRDLRPANISRARFPKF